MEVPSTTLPKDAEAARKRLEKLGYWRCDSDADTIKMLPHIDEMSIHAWRAFSLMNPTLKPRYVEVGSFRVPAHNDYAVTRHNFCAAAPAAFAHLLSAPSTSSPFLSPPTAPSPATTPCSPSPPTSPSGSAPSLKHWNAIFIVANLPDCSEEMFFEQFLLLFSFLGKQPADESKDLSIDFRSLLHFLLKHVHFFQAYCANTRKSLFCSRDMVEKELKENEKLFFRLRFAEGRFDRRLHDLDAKRRQPVYRQLVCSIRRLVPGDRESTKSYKLEGSVMHHLLLIKQPPTWSPTPSAHRDELGLLGLDGCTVYDGLQFLQRVEELISTLLARAEAERAHDRISSQARSMKMVRTFDGAERKLSAIGYLPAHSGTVTVRPKEATYTARASLAVASPTMSPAFYGQLASMSVSPSGAGPACSVPSSPDPAPSPPTAKRLQTDRRVGPAPRKSVSFTQDSLTEALLPRRPESNPWGPTPASAPRYAGARTFLPSISASSNSAPLRVHSDLPFSYAVSSKDAVDRLSLPARSYGVASIPVSPYPRGAVTWPPQSSASPFVPAALPRDYSRPPSRSLGHPSPHHSSDSSVVNRPVSSSFASSFAANALASAVPVDSRLPAPGRLAPLSVPSSPEPITSSLTAPSMDALPLPPSPPPVSPGATSSLDEPDYFLDDDERPLYDPDVHGTAAPG